MNPSSSRAKIIFANIALLCASICISMLAAEGLARMVLDPVDYLNPTLELDEFLNHRIRGYTGGHDEWGFRNVQRPKTAEIVCIGDSLTYGVAALASESWPADLGKLRNETVYNMSLGGYGPIQYLHLMRTLAIKLQPKIVIVGFYFGNDLLDVYNVARFNSKWSDYAHFGDEKVEGPAFIFPRQPGKFLGGLRDWLSKNSLLYVVITKLPAFEFIRERELSQRISGAERGSLIHFRDDKHNMIFNLDPEARFLDLSDPRIQAALIVTKRVLLDMRDFSEKAPVRLIVLLLPTKERVYRNVLKQSGFIDSNPALRQAIDQEDVARTRIIGTLNELNIETLDLLPELETGVKDRDLFPLTDPHPNKEGYSLIARTVNRYLNASR
jgi:lysophospholipase L1-like esterase